MSTLPVIVRSSLIVEILSELESCARADVSILSHPPTSPLKAFYIISLSTFVSSAFAARKLFVQPYKQETLAPRLEQSLSSEFVDVQLQPVVETSSLSRSRRSTNFL